MTLLSAQASHSCEPTSQRSIAPDTPGPAQLWTVFWATVAALIPIIETQKNFGITYLSANVLETLVLGGLIASAALRHVERPIGMPIWFMGGIVIPFSGFVSGDGENLVAGVSVAVQFALLCALGPPVFKYYVERSRNFVPWVLGAFLASQTVSAVIGLVQLSGAVVLGEGAIAGRSTGLAGHPNILGIMSVVALLVGLALLENISWPKAAGLWLVLTINAFTLLATGSLSSMLAGAVGIAIFLVGRRRVFVAVFFSGALWIIGALVGLNSAWFVSFLEYRYALVTGQARFEGDASIDIRLRTYEWALDHIANDPAFGIGLHNPSAGTYNGVTPVHNHLLHAWYQGGFLLFVWFVAATVVLVIAIASAFALRKAVGCAAFFGAILTFAMTSAFFMQLQYWLPLLLAVAMVPTTPYCRRTPPGQLARGAAPAGRRLGRRANTWPPARKFQLPG